MPNRRCIEFGEIRIVCPKTDCPHRPDAPPTPEPDRPLPDWLSPSLLCDREWEIARMLVDDLSCKAIGCAVGVSVRTVEAYRAHIFATLGIRGVGALTRLAQLWGKVGPNPDVRPIPPRKAQAQPRRSPLTAPSRSRLS